jgi:hypothetical protein
VWNKAGRQGDWESGLVGPMMVPVLIAQLQVDEGLHNPSLFDGPLDPVEFFVIFLIVFFAGGGAGFVFKSKPNGPLRYLVGHLTGAVVGLLVFETGCLIVTGGPEIVFLYIAPVIACIVGGVVATYSFRKPFRKQL